MQPLWRRTCGVSRHLTAAALGFFSSRPGIRRTKVLQACKKFLLVRSKYVNASTGGNMKTLAIKMVASTAIMLFAFVIAAHSVPRLLAKSAAQLLAPQAVAQAIAQGSTTQS